MSKGTKVQRIDMRQLMKDREKSRGYFTSSGVSQIKVTRMEGDKPVEEFYEIPIRPVSDHPLIKKFQKENPPPKPPVKTGVLLNKRTGQEFTKEGVTIDEARNDPNYVWADVYNYADKKYNEELEEYQNKLRTLWLMICFGVEEDYGIDGCKDFEERLSELGFTPNQLNKIGNDIKRLDFLPVEK